MSDRADRDEAGETGGADTSIWRGRLLVASPVLTDPNFDRTVILLLEHGPEGALGLVLNRPSELPVAEVLPQWDEYTAPPRAMFLGGPVQPNAVICLALADAPTAPTGADARRPTAVPGISLVDLDGDPATIGSDVALRSFAGYAGWGEGQLEAEIDEGSWFVVDPIPGDPFAAAPSGLWRSVLARQPEPLARYALYPADPRVN